MILGGGQAQLGLINTAKEMGIYVICVGIVGDYPGYKIADRVVNLDIFDKEGILNLAKEEGIDGISIMCTDFGLETVGYINDNLHLKGVSYSSAKLAANKLLMKQKLEEAGVNTAKFRIARNDKDVLNTIKELSFPLIVKAVDLQGSRGIYVCRSGDELLKNYHYSISESRYDYCLIEEFIEGTEFGTQAFIEDGEVLFVEPHADDVLRFDQTNIPIGHSMPLLAHDDPKYIQIHSFTEKAIKALGFDNCAVNVDLIMKDDIPYIIELTGRAGANFLPELTGYYLGINYYKMVILAALGKSAKEYYSQKTIGSSAVLTKMLYSQKAGRIDKIKTLPNENVKELFLYIKEGDQVNAFKSSNDCIGKYLVTGSTIEDCRYFSEYFEDNCLRIEVNE